MSLSNGVGITSYGDRCRMMTVEYFESCYPQCPSPRIPHPSKIGHILERDSHALAEPPSVVQALHHKSSLGGGMAPFTFTSEDDCYRVSSFSLKSPISRFDTRVYCSSNVTPYFEINLKVLQGHTYWYIQTQHLCMC